MLLAQTAVSQYNEASNFGALVKRLKFDEWIETVVNLPLIISAAWWKGRYQRYSPLCHTGLLWREMRAENSQRRKGIKRREEKCGRFQGEVRKYIPLLPFGFVSWVTQLLVYATSTARRLLKYRIWFWPKAQAGAELGICTWFPSALQLFLSNNSCSWMVALLRRTVLGWPVTSAQRLRVAEYIHWEDRETPASSVQFQRNTSFQEIHWWAIFSYA